MARSTIASAQQATRPFTVADDIELTRFGFDATKAIRFSPDGNYFAVYAERGRLDLNRVEDSLRFYRSEDVENFLKHSDESQPPSCVWVVTRSHKDANGGDGIIRRGWRWLADSSGVSFLESTAEGDGRLFLADLRKRTIGPLTPVSEDVNAFDIVDRNRYVYTVADPVEQTKLRAEREAPAIVGTGRNIWQLLFPDDPVVV